MLKVKEYYQIKGRTEACEFIGSLINEYKYYATCYKNRKRFKEADIFIECADLLDRKIESFANTK